MRKSPMSGYGAGGAFAASEAVFAGLVAELGGADAAGWTHAELEKRLQDRGRELLRQLLQDRMSLSAVTEQRLAGVADSDGVDPLEVWRVLYAASSRDGAVVWAARMAATWVS
jgi:hypothetical protein